LVPAVIIAACHSDEAALR